LRKAVLAGDEVVLRGNISEILPSQYDFELRICKLDQACGLQNPENYVDREIFSDEVSVSVTLDSSSPDFDPRKIRLFVWDRD